MKYIIITLLFVSSLCYGFTQSQKKLIDLSKKELIELNTALIKNKKNLKELKDKDVYIKAKLVDKENGKYKIVVSDIILDNPDNKPETDSVPNDEYLYLKGKIINDDDNDFKLDIEYVLPEDNNTYMVDNNNK